MQGRRIHQVELRPVGHHQRDRVTAAHPKPGQACRDLPHPPGVLPPGERRRASRHPQRHLLRIPRHRTLERLTERDRNTIIRHRSLLSRSRHQDASPRPAAGSGKRG